MMLPDIIIQPTTRRLVESYIQAPHHALLLSGVSGSGLGSLARQLASLLVTHPTDITMVLPDEKSTISIDHVRHLYVATRGKRVSRHVVMIDDIDMMSFDAQNAFLKLLEEPNNMTFFILTTHRREMLLPTIVSRVQHIAVRAIDRQASEALIVKQGVIDVTRRQQMIFLATGLPAELTRLATDDDYFEQQSVFVRVARELLTKPLHERLVAVARYNDRADAQKLVATVQLLVYFMLTRTPTDERLIRTTHSIEETAERLRANGHVRTQLVNLAWQLG